MTIIKMKNELVNKVINSKDNMYDTKNYRYVWNPEKQLMKRINIECVGRTSYLNPENWEVCEISKEYKQVKEMKNKKLCIMPEMPYCPACKYGYILEIDETECDWHCIYDGSLGNQ